MGDLGLGLGFRCMHAPGMHLAQGAQHRGQCHVDTVDVHLMTDLHRHARAIQVLDRLAAPALLHTYPLVSLIESKHFDVWTAFPCWLWPRLLHDAQRLHDLRL